MIIQSLYFLFTYFLFKNLVLYSQILSNDIQRENEFTDPLIQPNILRGPVNRQRYKQLRNKNKRYIPFYYNPTYPNTYDQVSNSPQFVTVTEEERQQNQQRLEEERQNKNISEIYVTGWEQLEKPQNDNSPSSNKLCYTFIIEFIKKSEIYFTKRTFQEFLELFKSLQKHTKYIFPKINPKQAEGQFIFKIVSQNILIPYKRNKAPKDIQEVFSKILQAINSEQIGRHINFQQFLMPKDKLDEFVVNQVATFSSNMMDTPQSFNRSSECVSKFESLRRKCSASPQSVAEQPVTQTMSFGQQSYQKSINIEKLFNKLDNRPRYQHISIVDWDYVDPDENSLIIHCKQNANTQIEDEVYFFIKFIKYKKNIQNQPFVVKRTIKDLIQLRNYYKLIYENRQFPGILPQDMQYILFDLFIFYQQRSIIMAYEQHYFEIFRNGQINKDNMKNENGYDFQKNEINQFFEYLIQNQLTSLNLRKFLEEGAELYEEIDNFSTQNLDNDSSQFVRNGNLN